MKALVCKEYGSTDNLVIEIITIGKPGSDELLIDVKAVGLNFPDALTVQGIYQAKPELPFVPGIEAAGIVAEIGEGVEDFSVGDRVICSLAIGAFAEQCIAAEVSTQPMAQNMTFEQAAGFCVAYGTSYYALKQRANLQPGETVVVLGAAGGVGITAVQIAKAMGAIVIAVASSEDKLDFACNSGADFRINYHTEDLKVRIKELTNGKGADVIYDPVGGDYTEQAYRSIAWLGRYLVIGFASGSIPKIPLNLPLLKGGDILGVFCGSWLQRNPAEYQKNSRELLQMVENEKLVPMTTEVYDFTDYANAFRCLTERRAKGKVILKL